MWWNFGGDLASWQWVEVHPDMVHWCLSFYWTPLHQVVHLPPSVYPGNYLPHQTWSTTPRNDSYISANMKWFTKMFPPGIYASKTIPYWSFQVRAAHRLVVQRHQVVPKSPQKKHCWAGWDWYMAWLWQFVEFEEEHVMRSMRTTRIICLVQHQLLAALLVVSLWCFRSFCSTEALCCLDPKAAMQNQEMSEVNAKGLNALNTLLLRASRHQAPWGCQHRPPSTPAEKFRCILYEITLIHCIVDCRSLSDCPWLSVAHSNLLIRLIDRLLLNTFAFQVHPAQCCGSTIVCLVHYRWIQDDI